MRTPAESRRRQKSHVFVAFLLFSMLLFLVQIWLFVAALEGYLAGHTMIALPAALASAAILLVDVWMLRGLTRLHNER